jgi:uncharacterized paraquat-inducible protein A
MYYVFCLLVGCMTGVAATSLITHHKAEWHELQPNVDGELCPACDVIDAPVRLTVRCPRCGMAMKGGAR